MISAYAPQVGLDEEVKMSFWEDFYEFVCGISHTEKLFVGRDFNGNIGAMSEGYDDVHGSFYFRVYNGCSMYLLDISKTFDLVIANSNFPKKEKYLVTFQSSVSRSQIDYLLIKKIKSGALTKDIARELGDNLLTKDIALTVAKTAALERLYEALDDRGENKKLYRLAKA
ncbi:uncharacterized protein LOC142166457 [Nicotiana tabacum]|uniref:Uncharacterized protein LOC142166457 n=1 Tax=Nicotiana tabacum TaxID=4097 RepID=A0AC58SAD9_TOBAC